MEVDIFFRLITFMLMIKFNQIFYQLLYQIYSKNTLQYFYITLFYNQISKDLQKSKMSSRKFTRTSVEQTIQPNMINFNFRYDLDQLMKNLEKKNIPQWGRKSQVQSKLKKGASKMKGKSNKNKIPQSCQLKKRPKMIQEEPVDTFQILREIIKTPCYQELNKIYVNLKEQHIKEMQQLFHEIKQLNIKLEHSKMKKQNLILKKQLICDQIEELEKQYQDIKLSNYDLLCEVNHINGNNAELNYDSLQEINIDEMNYEQMLLLEEEIGSVCQGLKPQQIALIPKKIFKQSELSSEQKCCICFEQLQNGVMVMVTDCNHIYHDYCLEKWSSINKLCPLCRNNLKSE